MLKALREKKFRKKKTTSALYLLLLRWAVAFLKLLTLVALPQQLLGMLAGWFVSDVINFCLETVIITKCMNAGIRGVLVDLSYFAALLALLTSLPSKAAKMKVPMMAIW